MTDPHQIADDPFAGAPEASRDPAIAGGADDAPVPTLTAASWQQAEAQLYPAVTERPDLYQRIVLLVRGTVDRLRERGSTTSALLAAADRGAELVAEVVEERGLSAAELDLGLIARAALAMRYREVRGEQSLQRRLRLIAAAGHAGQSWVVVQEAGHAEGDPFLPYHRLEVEVATGRALLVSAAADDDFREVHHTVQVVQVDLDNGIVQEVQAGAPADTFPDAAAREAQVSAVKARGPLGP
jgi:hypothetical protein